MKTARLTFMFLIAMLANSIQAETINCTPIISLPATINVQGLYCLTGNLSTSQTSGTAITINANNVTIDLNGWKLGGQGAGAGTLETGIYSSANNVTIKNGIVRGFEIGIQLAGSGAVVQYMLVDSNTSVGILTQGSGSLVENNQVVNTGGSTSTYVSNAVGIWSDGTGTVVSDNIISILTVACSSGCYEYGITVNSPGITVSNNIVSNAALPTGGAVSYGINTDDAIVLNNVVNVFMTGINTYGGIYKNNTANDCTTNFAGTGTDGGGNSP